jgi:hypothetical protein
MNKVLIKPFNVINHSELPEVSLDQFPTDGDSIEIGGEMYYVCEKSYKQKSDTQMIGVIPLVVRNPRDVSNIENYIECLSIAHRKVQFRNNKGHSDLKNSDEMIIT